MDPWERLGEGVMALLGGGAVVKFVELISQRRARDAGTDKTSGEAWQLAFGGLEHTIKAQEKEIERLTASLAAERAECDAKISRLEKRVSDLEGASR